MELSNDDWPPGMDKKDAGGARYYKVHSRALVDYTERRAAEVSFSNWGTGKKNFPDSSIGRKHARIVVHLIDNVKEVCGQGNYTPSLLICVVKTRQWQDLQMRDMSDPEPWSAYYRVLQYLDRSLRLDQQSGFQQKFWDWVDSCLQDTELQHECPPLSRMLWQAKEEWQKDPLCRLDEWHDSWAFEPLRQQCDSSAQAAGSNTLIDVHGSRTLEHVSSRQGSNRLIGDGSEQPDVDFARFVGEMSRATSDPAMPAASNADQAEPDQPTIGEYVHPYTGIWEQCAQTLDQALLSNNIQHGQRLLICIQQACSGAKLLETSYHASSVYWRRRSGSTPPFSAGDIAVVRGNQLFSTLDCGAMQPADQSVIIVVDVLNAEKLGTFPGDMDALEGHWCVALGTAPVWVTGKVAKHGLIAASLTQSCIGEAADLHQNASLQRVVAVAMEPKETMGKGRVTALALFGFNAVAALGTGVVPAGRFVGGLAAAYEQADDSLKTEHVQMECSLKQRMLAATRSTSHAGHHSSAWHLMPVSLTALAAEALLPFRGLHDLHALRQSLALQTEHMGAHSIPAVTAQLQLGKALGSSMQGASQQEGVQQIHSAIAALAGLCGHDSDDVIAVTHDVLVPAMMTTNQEAALTKLRTVLTLCQDKHGSFSLAAIQCMRNMALSLMRQGDLPAAESQLRAALALTRAWFPGMSKSKDGDPHNVEASIIFELADFLTLQGRFLEAEVSLQHGLQMLTKCKLSRHDGQPTPARSISSELARVLLWCAKRASDRQDLLVADRIVAGLELLLEAPTNSTIFPLLSSAVGMYSGGACVGAVSGTIAASRAQSTVMAFVYALLACSALYLLILQKHKIQ